MKEKIPSEVIQQRMKQIKIRTINIKWDYSHLICNSISFLRHP
jgi:hypothetical protein